MWRAGARDIFPSTTKGTCSCIPRRERERSIDLKKLIDTLVLRGISLPILIRFAEILKHRLQELHDAFDTAIREHKYNAGYCCVYPIKVNQQRQVVEEILEFGKPFKFGMEAGSKPELLAVMALADNETPIICNGFKDDEYIEMAMLAQKVGRRIIPVVEKYTELALIAKYAERVGVRPTIGIRAKLASRGSGRWKSSGGYRSKFGLSIAEVMRALEELKLWGMQDCLKLLHFHLGSQITNIRQVKGAVNEAVRVYTELWRAGATGLTYMDVGGGLGVDYDGSQTDFESSVNYTLQEYANDVVYHIQNVCDEANVPHPTIITESGRAIAAYHSVLVFNVLGVSGPGDGEEKPDSSLPNDPEQPLIDLARHCDRSIRAAYPGARHDSRRRSVRRWICSASLSAAQSALRRGESLLGGTCWQSASGVAGHGVFSRKNCKASTPCSQRPISAIFLCFRACRTAGRSNSYSGDADSSAQQPTHNAVLGDIACDSDGKVDQFIDHTAI